MLRGMIYTPLECLSMGVPAITSDLAGSGSPDAGRRAPTGRRADSRLPLATSH
jgi:hypothetical protein